MARNQCDGCCAGRPRVTLKNGEWIIDPNGKTHIMNKHWIGLGGAVSYYGYPNLMGCTAHLYAAENDHGFDEFKSARSN